MLLCQTVILPAETCTRVCYANWQKTNVPQWHWQVLRLVNLFFNSLGKIIMTIKEITDIHRSKVNTVWSVSSNAFSHSAAYWVCLAKTLEPCRFLPCSTFKLNGWNCFCLKSTFSGPRSARFITAPKPNQRANEEEWRGRGRGEGGWEAGLCLDKQTNALASKNHVCIYPICACWCIINCIGEASHELAEPEGWAHIQYPITYCCIRLRASH